MIRHYIKTAFRNLLKYKAQNIISIIGLSVGILCFSICLYCSRYINSTDKCFTHWERIADINLYTPAEEPYSGTPATLFESLRQLQFQEVEAFTFVAYPRPRSYNVETIDKEELPYEDLYAMEVDTAYHSVFTPEVLQGSWAVASQTPNAVILTRSLAHKIFGLGENPIGKRMTLAQRLFSSPDTTPRTGGTIYTIQAIIEDIPLNTSLSFLQKIDMLILNDSEGLIQFDGRDSMTGGLTFALLRPGKTSAQLEASFRAMDLKHTIFNEKNTVSASNFGKLFREKSVAPYFAGITFIVGLLILLTGLLNFFHFLTGSYLNRSHEFGIRKVNGSNGNKLFWLLFTQAIIISFIAFLLTFCLIEIFTPYLSFSLFDFTLVIERDLLLIQTIEYMAGVILLCLLLCLFTVWRMKHASIQSSIYKNKSKRHKQKIRNCLLGIQFFICWLFIVFTVALYLQANKTGSTLFNTLTEKEKSEIISIPMDYRFMKNDEKLALIERISQHPDIKDKMLTDINYLKGISGTSMQTEKDNRESSLEVNIMNVPNNFFEFMNIPILSGHVLKTNSDMVADRKLVERIKKDLLGTTLYNYQDSYTVCGICSDFVADTYNQSQGFVFLPCDFKYYVGHCYLKCVPGKAEEVEAFVKKMLEENLPPSIQLHISTLQEDIHQAQAIENNMKGIILFFSFVSLIITLLGVYSAITLDTERRQKEVAIRKVNGAGLKQIIILFARTYIYQLVLSATMAFPLCYAILQLWKNMYIVFFNDGPLFWISIFIIVAVITTLTIIFRILKLIPNTDAQQFTEKINHDKIPTLIPEKTQYYVDPLSDIYFTTPDYDTQQPLPYINQSNVQLLYISLAAALLVLIIACCNYTNMSLSRVLQQLKMIHVEKLMGSSLKDIRIQLFGDAFLTVLLAFGLSLLIINDCLSFFNGLFASHLNVHFFFSLQMLPLLVLFVLVMSIVPAWYISHRLSQLSFSEYKTLYGGKKKQRFIALLVILQFSISIGLIFATLVANEQINLIKERAYCYENRIEIGDFNAAPATILKEELEKHVQGIESIALSQGSILNSWIRELSIKQADGTEKSSYLLMLYSDANLVKTMGFKLLSGNAPEQLQKQYAYPALVNESYVRMLIPAGINAIGKPLKEFDQSADSLYIIGGVLEDFPFSSLENEITPVILYLPPTERMSGANYLQIKLIESNKQETLHQIAQIWEKMNEGEIFQYTDMHQDFMKRNGKVLSLSKLLIAYSLIGLILTCFGLFGISWYATRQRIREISIRKIHGATSRQIVLLLNKPFCLQILLAYILAVPIVYWLMHHWHEQFAYKAPFTVMDFLLPLCIVWIISAVTVCLQSYLLNKTNPIDCIKSE